MAHVAEYKKKVVKNIVDLSSQYPIVGVVNMENLPAPQLQKMRAKLRDKIKFAMTKKRLMKIALEQIKSSKKDIEKLEEHFIGMPALIFTKENPFRLSKMLKKNKSAAPAKAGQTAPKDIIVPAGPTSFAPGPIIGELSQIGIKTGVEGGKVAVKEDSVVVKKGEKIKPKVAEILTRLGIEPMEVGLDLVATYEDGIIYSKDILDIDEDKFMADLRGCANGAFNVAIFVAYPTKDTIEHLISKAFNDSKALGLSENIIDEGIIDELLGKAHRQMMGLSSTANIEVKEEPKEEKKEEAKPEEKEAPKEEKKPEAKKEEPKVEKPEPKEEKKEEVKEEKKPEVKEEPQPEVKKEEPKSEPKEEKKPEVKEEKKPDTKEVKPEVKEEKPEVQAPKVEEKPKEDEEKKKAEEQKKQEEAKKAEEAKKEEEQKKAEEERERQEAEKRKLEEQKKKEADTTEDRVREMVEKTKKMAEGPGPTASDILEEVDREQPKKPEIKKEEVKKEIKEELSETERLMKELQKKGTLRGIRTEEIGKKKPEVKKDKNDDEKKKVEELVEQLKRKGTLRK